MEGGVWELHLASAQKWQRLSLLSLIICIYIRHDTKLPKDAVMSALGYSECSVKRAHWSWRLLLAGVEGAVIHVSA